MFTTSRAHAPSHAGATGSAMASFKCGMMHATALEDGKSFRVEPDQRRGVINLQRGADGAMHFIWKDRATQQIVEDLLVFPGDQELTRVQGTSKPEDRVYLLQFKSSPSKRLFFWVQEPGDASKDVERVAELNRLMNPAPRQAKAGGAASSATGAGASMAETTAPQVGFDELTAILSGLGYSDSTPAESTTSTSAEQTAPAAKPKEEGEEDSKKVPSLARVVTGDALERAIFSESEEVKRGLLALLPDGQQTEQDLHQTLRSPQLRQSLQQFTRALRDDSAFPAILASMGLELDSAALALWERGDEVGALLLLLQEEAEKKRE